MQGLAKGAFRVNRRDKGKSCLLLLILLHTGYLSLRMLTTLDDDLDEATERMNFVMGRLGKLLKTKSESMRKASRLLCSLAVGRCRRHDRSKPASVHDTVSTTRSTRAGSIEAGFCYSPQPSKHPSDRLCPRERRTCVGVTGKRSSLAPWFPVRERETLAKRSTRWEREQTHILLPLKFIYLSHLR